MRRVRRMRVVACNHRQGLVPLREDKLRRNPVCGGIARLGDDGCTRRGLRGGGRHSIGSGDDHGAPGEHGQFPCNTAEEGLPIKRHTHIPFLV